MDTVGDADDEVKLTLDLAFSSNCSAAEVEYARDTTILDGSGGC